MGTLSRQVIRSKLYNSYNNGSSSKYATYSSARRSSKEQSICKAPEDRGYANTSHSDSLDAFIYSASAFMDTTGTSGYSGYGATTTTTGGIVYPFGTDATAEKAAELVAQRAEIDREVEQAVAKELAIAEEGFKRERSIMLNLFARAFHELKMEQDGLDDSDLRSRDAFMYREEKNRLDRMFFELTDAMIAVQFFTDSNSVRERLQDLGYLRGVK